MKGWFGSEGLFEDLSERIRSGIASIKSSSSKGIGFVIFALFILVVLISTRWIDRVSYVISSISGSNAVASKQYFHHHTSPNSQPITLRCPLNDTVKPTCKRRTSIATSPSPSPSSSPRSSSALLSSPSSSSCPEYFRYIHEDLRPWNATGITVEMVERAKKHANFRLVVLDGRAYVEKYSKAFQTRDVFTLWGIVQLLNLYPGRVPDLDLMFNCDDIPIIRSSDYGPSKPPPPPVFRYCKDGATLDILFPDWSFWGWPEVNIKPWVKLAEEIKEGNKRVKWEDREPYAFWKGNQWVARTRQDLFKCNVSNGREWNARLFTQDWEGARRSGFKGSNLANQCDYRYKIYIEGRAWSVSEKYILACDSPTLLVNTPFMDFFSRGLMPMQHYWPIRPDQKCKSIKFAVDWGNKHHKMAKRIGKVGSDFIQEEVQMDYVYDYMLHLLTEYAKLLRYKPRKPEKATEFCLESMACKASGLVKTFLTESMARSAYDSEPCTLPPPFDPKELEEIAERKRKSLKEVEMLEKRD
ncbi:uncharacterized protein [Typha angustifolia]|uniref:uncharacterized protein n=1 Tax=Typha angustifolia TaxID=59011 RepID=UPI003C2C3134